MVLKLVPAELYRLRAVVPKPLRLVPRRAASHLLLRLSLGDDSVVSASPPEPPVVFGAAPLVSLRRLHLRLTEVFDRPLEELALERYCRPVFLAARLVRARGWRFERR